MAGIIFLRTANLEKITDFYIQEVGMKIWIEQPDIKILQHENLLLGFHHQDQTDRDSLITFFYETREEVDRMYETLIDTARDEPKENEKYRIYNFFASDPEGRTIEFQKFLHELPNY